MSDPLQLVIPMSGLGERFLKAGYSDPKPLIPINGKPIIEKLLEKFPREWPTTFVLSTAHQKTDLPSVLKKLRPQGQIHFVEPHKKGPGWALHQILPHLNLTQPVLVSYCDFGLIWDPWDFLRYVNATECESCVICYRGFHAHYLSPTTYAFCRMENDWVKEIKEKGSFTSQRENEPASAGLYYFRTGNDLCSALQYQLDHSVFHNDEAYISLTVQSLLLKSAQARVRIYEIPYFFQWGTPEDLQIYEYWEKNWSNYFKHSSLPTPTYEGLTLIPMAGLGSRFTGLTPLPKPLIPVGKKRIFEWATQSLPQTSELLYVTTQAIAAQLPPEILRSSLLLPQTPNGQALTTLEGLKSLKQPQSILVSSCDHIVVLSDEKWKTLVQSLEVDAAIMTIRGYPGCQRSPKSFAYVESKAGSLPFETIQRISVKEPISNHPSRDQLLVGVFWFKDSNLLIQLIDKLIERNQTVRGEFYLDSVFDLYLELGKNVVSFPLEAYMNLGDPDSLSEFLYWREVFSSEKTRPRPKFGIFSERDH